jgi:hypothetical protein
MQTDGAGGHALQAPKIQRARANEFDSHAFSRDRAPNHAATVRFFSSVEEELDLAARGNECERSKKTAGEADVGDDSRDSLASIEIGVRRDLALQAAEASPFRPTRLRRNLSFRLRRIRRGGGPGRGGGRLFVLSGRQFGAAVEAPITLDAMERAHPEQTHDEAVDKPAPQALHSRASAIGTRDTGGLVAFCHRTSSGEHRHTRARLGPARAERQRTAPVTSSLEPRSVPIGKFPGAQRDRYLKGLERKAGGASRFLAKGDFPRPP